MKKRTKSLIFIGLLCAILLMAVWFASSGQIPIISPQLTHSAIVTQGADEISIGWTAYAHDVETQVAKMLSESSLMIVPTSSINSQNWIDKWLHEPTCQIPCWENITPGTTKITDAVKMLTQIPGIHITGAHSLVSWNFENDTGGFVDYDLTTYTVLDIALYVRGRNLIVNELISAHDEPTNIVMLQCSEVCTYGLYYKDKGMLIELAGPSDLTIEISPETKIFRIRLFTSSPVEGIAMVIGSNNMIEWIGYGTYDFYSQ